MWSTPYTITISISIQFWIDATDQSVTGYGSPLRIAIWNRRYGFVDLDSSIWIRRSGFVDQDSSIGIRRSGFVDLDFRIATIMCGPHAICFRSASLRALYIVVHLSNRRVRRLDQSESGIFFGATQHHESTNSKLYDCFTTASRLYNFWLLC